MIDRSSPSSASLVVAIVGICIVCNSMSLGYRHVSLSVFLSDSVRDMFIFLYGAVGRFVKSVS